MPQKSALYITHHPRHEKYHKKNDMNYYKTCVTDFGM